MQYKIAQFLIGSTARVFFGWRIIGHDNIPQGGALIAANHLSILDPPLIGSAIEREMFYYAKAELFRNLFFGRLIRAFNAFPARRGEADRQAWKTSINLLKSGKLLLFFPEGTRSKSGDMQSAKSGLARLALASGAPIVPAAISGSNRLRDVFLRRHKLRVGFAQPVPIDSSVAGGSEEHLQHLTDTVMAEIKRLKLEVENI